MFPSRTVSVISKPRLIDNDPNPEVYCTHDNDDDWMTNSQFDYKDMSVSLWHSGFQKSADASADRYLVSMGESATKEFAIVINSNDLKVKANFSAHGNGGTNNPITINNVFTAFYWTHTLVTYSGTDSILRVYVDGVLKGSDLSAVLGYTGDSTSLGFDSNLHVNNRAHDLASGPYDETDGAFGDLAIYDKVLSADEVKRVYNNKQPFDHKNSIMKKNCKFWWRFGSGFDRYYPGGPKSPKIFYNQMKPVTHKVLFKDDFSSNINYWDAAGSNHTVTHSTDILGPTGNSGVMKVVGTANTDAIFVNMASNISGIQANHFYIISGWVYWSSSGEDHYAANYYTNFLLNGEDAAYTNARRKTSSYGYPNEGSGASPGGGLDKWQFMQSMVQVYDDTTFTFNIGAASKPGEGAIFYLSDIIIHEVYNEGFGCTNNASSHGRPIMEAQGVQYSTLLNNSYRTTAMGLHGHGTFKSDGS